MIIMLGNQVELWELMLAGIKLGMVMIPTTTLMGPRDMQDRVERGGARWAAVGSANIGKFAAVRAVYTRLIEVGGGDRPANTEALQYAESYDRRRRTSSRRPHRGRRDHASLLHLGHYVAGQTGRAHPHLVPGGTSVHDVLDWPGTRRRPPQRGFTRLGQARMVQRFHAVDRRGLRLRLQLRSLRCQGPHGTDGPRRRHEFLRPAHRMAHAHPSGPDPAQNPAHARWFRRANPSTPR